MRNHLFEVYKDLDDNEFFTATNNKITRHESTATNSSNSKKDSPTRSNKTRTKFLNLIKRSNRVSPAAEAPKAENNQKSFISRSCRNVRRSFKILKQSFINSLTYCPPFSCFKN